MATTIKGSEGGQYEPASEDIHDAVCCEFKDLGVISGPYGAKHQGRLIFQVEETDERGQRKEVTLFFTMTLGNEEFPSKIRKVIEKWRGKSITDEEQAGGFDLESLVGQPCRLDVSHKESKGGRIYGVIDSIARAGKTKLEPENYVPRDERGNGNSDSDDSVPF